MPSDLFCLPRGWLWRGVAFARFATVVVLPAVLGPAAPAATENAAPVLLSAKGGAAKWKSTAQLEKAAAAGQPRACYDLALLSLEGAPEVKRDPVRAVALYEKAAAGGIADAWFRLGKMFHDGIGVAADLPRSFNYYLKGARAGLPEAQYNVGAMLVSGRGVKRDLVEGLAWLIVAGKSGTPAEAEKKVRSGLKRRPADIAAAEARATALLADPFAEPVAVDTRKGLSPPPPPLSPTVPIAPAVERPKIEIAPPKVELPINPAKPEPGR